MSLGTDLPIVSTLGIDVVGEEPDRVYQSGFLKLRIRGDGQQPLHHVPGGLDFTINVTIVFATFKPVRAHRTVPVLQAECIFLEIIHEDFGSLPLSGDWFASGTTLSKSCGQIPSGDGAAAGCSYDRLGQLFLDQTLKAPRFTGCVEPYGVGVQVMGQADQRKCQLLAATTA